jgi:lysophospholipase L1-like esterase
VGDVWNLGYLGDSKTYGTGSTDSGGYRSRLSRRLQAGGYAFYAEGPSALGPDDTRRSHCGTQGQTAATMAATMTTLASRWRPRVILVYCGTNDILQDADAATTFSRIQTVVGNASTGRSDWQVLLMTIGPFVPGSLATANDETVRLAVNALIRAHAWDAAHVKVVENPTTTADLVADGVHYSDAGYDKIAAAWETELIALGLPRWR